MDLRFVAMLALLVLISPFVQGILQKSPECSKSLGCISNYKSTIMLTWKATKSDVHFVLRAQIGDRDVYAAVGFSDDNKMGDDEVTECVKSSNTVKVYSSYNTGRNNGRFTDTILKNTSGVYAQGVTECTFTRPIVTPSSNIRYDLDTRWYILLVSGRLVPGTNIKLQHNEQSASASPVSLTAVGSFQTVEYSYRLIYVHACLMILAWVTMASVSVTVARHYKGLLPATELFGKRIWFHIHRTLMVLVVVLTAIGFVVIFVHVGGYVKAADGNMTSRAHPVLGIIVMVLTILNPIIAVFRPLPNSHRRPIFNWVHRIVGMLAKILAVVTIFLGLKLEAAEAPKSTLAVLGAFVIWHIAVNLTQFAITVKRQRDKKAGNKSMKQASTDDCSQPKVRAFQEILLILHSVVAIAICIALFSLLLTRHDEVGA